MFRGPSFIVRTMQEETTPIFKRLWYDPAPTGNRTHKSSWSVLGPPYCRLLRSAGATEDLFVTRELHQELPSRIPKGSVTVDAPSDRRPFCYTFTVHRHVLQVMFLFSMPSVDLPPSQTHLEDPDLRKLTPTYVN